MKDIFWMFWLFTNAFLCFINTCCKHTFNLCRLICPRIAVWFACWLLVDLLLIVGWFAHRLPFDVPADCRLILLLISRLFTSWLPFDLHIILIHILLTITTAAQNENAISYYTVRRLYFLAVVLWEVYFCCICNTPNHLYEHFTLNSAAALSNCMWAFSRVYARVWFCALKQDFCRAFGKPRIF